MTDPRLPHTPPGADDPHQDHSAGSAHDPEQNDAPDRPGHSAGPTPEPNGHSAGSAPDPLEHPGLANYPAATPVTAHVPSRREPLPPLHPPRTEQITAARGKAGARKPPPMPKKLTVTRVAAMRGRELTGKGIASFQRAAKADGADKSGLTALTYATMANFASDAALAIALANTLFFSAATGEDKTKVALYLVITIAPFALIAPLIGPLLDRLQQGRRIALATSFGLRTVLAVVLVFNFDSWVLYPAALGMLVLSKSFAVLKSAVTPRVLPPEIDLVRVNSRLTVFGLLGGTIAAGAIAGGIAFVADSPGALWFVAAITVLGAYLSMRIPSWVEITEGEVPATLSYHADQHGDRDYAGSGAPTENLRRTPPSPPASSTTKNRRQPLGRAVIVGLWGNGTIRILTGFLTLYIAFVAKSRTEHEPLQQAAMLGLVGAAAGLGNFSGNALGARIKLGRPSLVVLRCTLAVTVVAVVAAVTDSLLTAAVAALVASSASALAKVSLDASLQADLPPESIASGFGRSETVMQLCWVLGGTLGVLLPTEYWLGFTVVSVLLTIGLVQTFLTYRGRSLLPGFGGNRPDHVEQEVSDGSFGENVTK
ncbi:MFS transporter [Rhodococcus sp. IEGM 1401]|uniref:MFS transporter n=1 Tax=unclassified Rhodococcus (in: high G+C Gram-positive bacteria) TaxID=192944 RepID=UPI0022B48459|nr:MULTISPECIES: MFS transporter [unclassified Rhodococcus (in: high G+C Gram-positive bacteria)]MCZ4561239.1 MFS transporter [Rhodococcus sp. IEGM 1401]MDI9921382.1 MFS transporter [Rhodococcus sp. IEGM 1372]MDV8033831.1 MFS transporter [Rhodococcus sp. IEGM 1414]MDV8074994.1 MFS transporter [Rhodococcus sp. IEGM 1370]